jgi:ribonuclease HI
VGGEGQKIKTWQTKTYWAAIGQAMGKKNWYAVAKGRVPGIYATWAECEAQVKGVASVFKGFATQQEAMAFMQQNGHSGVPAAALRPPQPPPQAAGGARSAFAGAKRARGASDHDNAHANPAAGSGDGNDVAGGDAKRPRSMSELRFVSAGPVPGSSSGRPVGNPTAALGEECNFDTRVRAYRAGESAACERHLLWFDGGSRGNGQASSVAGSGTVIYRADCRVWAGGRYLGSTTNNVAEYTGLLHGLYVASRLGVTRLEVRGDSKLVLCQVKGEWKCEKPHLKPLCEQAQRLRASFDECTLVHVPRAENAEADALANRAMDDKADFETGAHLSAKEAERTSGMQAPVRAAVVKHESISSSPSLQGGKKVGGFEVFCVTNKDMLRDANPEASAAEILQTPLQMWKQLNNEQNEMLERKARKQNKEEQDHDQQSLASGDGYPSHAGKEKKTEKKTLPPPRPPPAASRAGLADDARPSASSEPTVRCAERGSQGERKGGQRREGGAACAFP